MARKRQYPKIERYHLGDMTFTLLAQGLTTYQIAERLTEELARRGVNDTISKATTSRWIKAARSERSEATREVVHAYIKPSIPQDLEAVNEILADLMARVKEYKRIYSRVKSIAEALAKVENALRVA